MWKLKIWWTGFVSLWSLSILQFWFEMEKIMDARWKPSHAVRKRIEFTKYLSEWTKRLEQKFCRKICGLFVQYSFSTSLTVFKTVKRTPPKIVTLCFISNLYIRQFTVFHWSYRDCQHFFLFIIITTPPPKTYIYVYIYKKMLPSCRSQCFVKTFFLLW
jgi:hypothetical protein